MDANTIAYRIITIQDEIIEIHKKGAKRLSLKLSYDDKDGWRCTGTSCSSSDLLELEAELVRVKAQYATYKK